MAATEFVFRADASHHIGGGHIMRCLALADALAVAGHACAFAFRPATLDMVAGLGDSGHSLLRLDDDGDDVAAMASEWPGGVDWLIVDHYGWGAGFESECRGWASRIMVIDDLADRDHDCDLLLNQTFGGVDDHYAPLVPAHCRLLLGPDYAVLRPQFAARRAESLARRAEQTGVERIFVNFGATDPDNVTALALEALRRAVLAVDVDVVLGWASPNLGPVRALVESLPFPVELHVGVDDMAALMARADLAIGAGGGSSLERCALGLPSLVIVTADNQSELVATLERRGAIRLCGRHDEVLPDDLARVIGALAADGAALRVMSASAEAICDGRGAARVARALGAPCAVRQCA